MKTISSLAAEIAALPKKDRDNLLSTIRMRTALSPDKRAPVRNDEALYNSIAAEIKKQLGGRVQHYGAFKAKSPQAKMFLEAAKTVNEYLDSAATLTDIQRASAYGLIAELAVRTARTWKMASVPVWNRVISALMDSAEMVEKAFPGYAGSGLLGKVLAVRQTGTTKRGDK